MKIRVGALFAGYGGLELALAQVAAEHPGAEIELVWYCEIDKAASKILAHRFPGVPNLGDVTKVDWHSVPKVDVVTGGSPCQDLSHAGKRAGMKAGTRSGLWASMCDAIDIIRPRLVVWENVRGALSAGADSALEQCAGCVGGGDDGPVLRALGRVLGDLAELGYDARWYGLRAADVGAAHGRWRVFVFAQPADADLSGLEGLADQAGTSQAGRHGHAESGAGGSALEHVRGQLTLLPTPAAQEPGGTAEQYHARLARHDGRSSSFLPLSMAEQRLLPTPRTSDTNGAGAHGTGGIDLRTAAARLLPTPTSSVDSGGLDGNGKKYGPTSGVTLTDAAIRQDWREYEAAIRRQEHAFGRPAPLPTETGPKGNPRLSPRFVEWLMGLPEGWVTDVPGISRNDMLKALGNGVCPPQAAAALRAFIHDTAKEVAA